MKCRAEVIVVSIIIGIILGVNLFCGSLKSMEGMSNLYDYKHDESEMHLGPNKVNSDKLFFFEGNEFKGPFKSVTEQKQAFSLVNRAK